MAYFLSHLLYIVVAAGALCALCLAAVLMARKNAENRTDEEDKERRATCSTCVMSAICMDMGQNGAKSLETPDKDPDPLRDIMRPGHDRSEDIGSQA